MLRIVAATLMLVVGACGLTRGNSASPTDTASLHPGTTEHTISWDGQQRTYRLHVPSALPVGSHPPLVVAGTFTSRCDHPPPIPFIAIHGLNDRAVSFEASSNTAETGADIRLPGAETIGRFFVADGCHDPMTTTAGPVHTQTGTCAPGLDVKVMTIEGAGHLVARGHDRR